MSFNLRFDRDIAAPLRDNLTVRECTLIVADCYLDILYGSRALSRPSEMSMEAFEYRLILFHRFQERLSDARVALIYYSLSEEEREEFAEDLLTCAYEHAREEFGR